jgi:biofilm PGA synthesis N-glycosyltransferase PgaC
MNFSIGIPCYNEAANIAKLLDRLLLFKDGAYILDEIIVVASGCTDGTENIVRGYTNRESRVRLLVQQSREGKAAAVNLFIKESHSEILLLMSGDILPDEGALAELLGTFDDSQTGVAAGQIIPLNRKDDFIGYYVRLFWRLHHRIALQGFKAGEAVAFRKVIDNIPADTATDETWIVMQVLDKGFSSRYIPQAVFRNRGPENLRDFFKVRRRHLIGYHHMRRLKPVWKLPETMDNLKVLALLKDEFRGSPRQMLFLVGSVAMEAMARLLAWVDFHLLKRNPFIWPTASSTKRLETGK